MNSWPVGNAAMWNAGVQSMGSSSTSASGGGLQSMGSESWQGDAAELANQMAMASLAQYQLGAVWGGSAASSTWQ